MKKIGLLCLTLGTLAAFVGRTQAQPAPSYTGHYVPGVEGIKGASLPPPGVYVRDYNAFYWANQLNGPNGTEGPANFNVFAYANLIRPIWITEWTVLGGNFGMDMIVPLQYTDLTVKMGGATAYDAQIFGIGDLYFEPATLSWHGKQWDAAFGYSFFAPTADSEPGTAKPGKGYWTQMLTAGATLYFDEAKTWSLSLLNRYEFNMEDENTGITPGQEWTLEWGLGKGVSKLVELGISGYCQMQTTSDSGSGASPNLDQALALGPEVTVVWPQTGILFSLRYLHEFDVYDRPQGNIGVLTLTRRF